MAKRFLIIDGYNFLHAAGMFPRRADGHTLDQARRRLFRFLEARLSPGERERARIVFDVRQNRREVPRQQHIAGLTILNAVEHPDADTLIEELIREHSAPRQLVVVSSDHRLQRAARARKAQAVKSEDFYEQMQQRTARHAWKPRPGHRSSPSIAPADPPEQLPPDLPEHMPGVIEDELAHWEARIRELDQE